MEAAAKITFPDGETFEQFLASLREMRAMYRDIAERQQKENAEEQKEYVKRHKELEQQMRETDRKIGELSNRFGELAEHLVAPGIIDKFNALGYHFYFVSPNGMVIRGENGKVLTEIDILLENSDCLMAVEVKTRPREKDIEHHIKRLEILKEQRRKSNNTPKKIYGAIAGAVFGENEKQTAIDAGFYVLEQSGDTMKMDIPDNFVPREW